MVLVIALLSAVSIVVPLALAWHVARLDAPALAAWLLGVANVAVFVALVLLVARWDIAGLQTRLALALLFGAALLWSLARHLRRPWWPASGFGWQAAAPLIAFGAALIYVVSGLLPPADARALALPLAGGRFVIAQGGGNTLLNHHADHAAQRFAADIVAVDGAGFRARGVLPAEPERYAVFGATVVSPCDGTVLAAGDGLPDLAPPRRDAENAAGNHVVIACNGMHVELAHLMAGSVAAAVGDAVEAGDTLGRVGNSGNTTEPHLHIHAVDPRTGEGVPLLFEGRAPVRNGVFDG